MVFFENIGGCFAIADIKLQAISKLSDEYHFFSSKTEFFEYVKYI